MPALSSVERSDSTAQRELDYHTNVDPHRPSAPSDVVLGAQDGLVNVLGVLLGVAASTGETRIVVAAGLATAVAESISMAAVAYTSTMARGAFYASEHARELRHVRAAPNLEREEIRQIYADKGFAGELLDRVVDTITANKEVWVAVMMAEEHGAVPISRKAALRSAVVVGVAAAVGSIVPLLPLFFTNTSLASWLSVLVAALTLFTLGAYKARVTLGSPVKSGLEIAAIGTVSAMAGYAIGLAFRAPVMP